MSTVVKDLGAVSAYAYAVEKGYTGTEAEFAELMADYAEVGQRAEDAAESALNSKTAAQTAATTATNKASEATTAAQTATTKAGEAQTSAQTASSKASEASQSAQTASEKADSITGLTATAQTLPSGSSASASYNPQTGVMSFGIPRGKDGTDGDDGYSPTASASKTGKTATITITDKNGTTSAQVEDGTDGTDGISPTVTITPITGGHRITITDADGTEMADVMDGHNGMVTEYITDTTPTITAQADTRYVCGEVSTLDITVPASGIIDVVFTSGSTATVLTVTPPTGMTMKWANGFDPTSLEANTTYEINILDGIYGAVMAWT